MHATNNQHGDFVVWVSANTILEYIYIYIVTAKATRWWWWWPTVINHCLSKLIYHNIYLASARALINTRRETTWNIQKNIYKHTHTHKSVYTCSLHATYKANGVSELSSTCRVKWRCLIIFWLVSLSPYISACQPQRVNCFLFVVYCFEVINKCFVPLRLLHIIPRVRASANIYMLSRQWTMRVIYGTH